eukprot:360880-Chlamydomonas_euryale.AAC.4
MKQSRAVGIGACGAAPRGGICITGGDATGVIATATASSAAQHVSMRGMTLVDRAADVARDVASGRRRLGRQVSMKLDSVTPERDTACVAGGRRRTACVFCHLEHARHEIQVGGLRSQRGLERLDDLVTRVVVIPRPQ